MSNDFKVMNDREYMLHRPEIFIGSMQESEYFGIYNYKYQGLKYVPGLLKIIEEILDNCVDESIRTNFEYANKIDVDIHDDPMYGLSITITDNGRGIPVVQYDGVYQAELSWTRPRAGTNFKDDGRVTIGRNGVGSACTCFLSKEFIGKSCDGNQEVIVKAYNNAETIETIIHKSKKQGTSVKFIPDLKRFNLDSFNEVYITLIKDRLFNLSLCYPSIEFRFNGEKFKSSLSNIAQSFHENAISIKTENECGTIVIAPSGEDEEFRHLSYFNGLNIKNGGVHIDYFIQGICSELIPAIKKKWKIDVLPNQIKQHLLLAIWVRNFPELKFDSQSKERVTNTHGELKSFLNIDFQKLVKKIINTEDIIMPMIDAILRKKEAADKRAATNASKKLQKKKIVNHISASSKDFEEKTIFIAEGLSASGMGLSVRDPRYHGFYSLRGKVLNTYEMNMVDILKNKELSELTTIIGLDLDNPSIYEDPEELFEITLDDTKYIAGKNDIIYHNDEAIHVQDLLEKEIA
jgi:DNA topoisomerase-2